MTDTLDMADRPATAFAGTTLIARGRLIDVALAAKTTDPEGPAVLVFDDANGRVIDLDLRGDRAEIAARLAPAQPPQEQEAPARGRGRPKLGVVAREVTLLPRHWEWLAAQPGGASQALRRMVDEARRADGNRTERRTAQEAAYRFMAAIAGDLPDFEETVRALFADDLEGTRRLMAEWPQDVRDHALALAGDPGAGALTA